jgi:hypothetical protein
MVRKRVFPEKGKRSMTDLAMSMMGVIIAGFARTQSIYAPEIAHP